ncbi:signal recognition particle subunit SRP68-like [Montipora capricornis]|uniref:signal recognition particle subunit SRP68-like n=1 Tax=Montipora capricornis TaxID=246305 RepID=UPI0035F1E872
MADFESERVDNEDEMEINLNEISKEDEFQQSALTLEILPLIKDSQGQHGLRHGDYQRYRQYCQRRLRRLYKTMHFQHGSRHIFKSKKVTKDLLKDVRYLHIPLMDAERAWSHAMELKLLANTEPRKKFHYIRRLRKAASHADQLQELCYGDACDARSKLEAQAYASFMKGSVSFELQNWKEALELFRQAKTIYEKLAGAFSEEQRGMYLQRVEEITPNISYCAYNLKEGSTDINDLMQLRLSATAVGGTHDPVLTAKIDEVIAQTRDKEAAKMTEVTWRGHTIPVKNEKARSFILHSQQSTRELDRAETLDSKLSLYDNLLMECKDALQAVKDELKGDTGSGKIRSHKTETQIANMQFLHVYISYIRLSKTVERNLLMAESMKRNLPPVLQTSVGEVTVESGPSNRKISKPEDLVRIYDIILQNLSDMADLPGIDQDLNFSKEIAAKMLHYKAQRCLFVAHSYLLAKKWREALSLFTRVLSHAASAVTHFQEINPPQTQVINNLQELISQTRGFKCSTYASYILEREVVADEPADMSLNEKPLSARLDHYVVDLSLTSKKPHVTAFPPDFEPVPCKPLFFDLALNQVQFPSLAHRSEERKAAGLAGYFKGWLWGSGS